jgi:signal transduction histidine kinase
MITRLKKIEFSNYYPLVFTLIFVSILLQYPLASFEALLYDTKVKYDLGYNHSKDIVLITMDEESDDFLGDTYPYSYATYARFLEKLISAKPKIINFFSQLPLESESKEGLLYLNDFKNKLKRFEAYGGKVNFSTELDEVIGEILPPRELQEFNFSLGQINIDNNTFSKDDVVRRAILNVTGEESSHLWTANEAKILNGEHRQKVQDINGAYYNDEADANFALFRYSSSPVYTEFKYRTIPFHRVLVGSFSSELFKDKIVLIGPNYSSERGNYLLTPFNNEEYKAPKIIVHAEIIDALIQGKTVKVIPRIYSNLLALFLAIFLSFAISKLRPKDGLIVTVSMLLFILFSSYLCFILLGCWIYTAHIVVTIFVVYYIWIPFRAIGEYQRRYAIQEETKLLKQVEKLKQNFLSLMSHDLKTPVAKIAGVADNLHQQNQDNPDVYEKAQIILDATKELNRFISSILDLTKIESSNFGLNQTNKDINQIIENVIDELSFTARQKSISIEEELGPLYPITIDVTLISRVISNLVENAIKYSNENCKIHIKSWDDQKWVYVMIEDNGPGISEEELPNVFEKFYRIKNDASHSIKGTGLGLYLVKYFVELHGGSIEVESNVNVGTKFVIKLLNK